MRQGPGTLARRLAAALAIPLVVAGCDAVGDRRGRLSEALIDLRTERRDLLDALYAEYGGGNLVRSLDEAGESAEGEASAGDGVLDVIRGLVEEGDRSLFEEQVRVVGRGERPVVLTTRAREFFALQAVRARCRDVVRLDAEIGRKQRALAALEPEPAAAAPR